MDEMFTEGDRYLKTTGIQLRQLQWQQRSNSQNNNSYHTKTIWIKILRNANAKEKSFKRILQYL
jgi:hypothetical protein